MKKIDVKTALDFHEGMRLDKFLTELLPESGLRQRRRLIENGFVLVNGRPRKTGFKIFSGAEVALLKEDTRSCAAEIASRLAVIAQTDAYAAVFKPDLIHSARVAGSPEPTAEECLNDLLHNSKAILVNRLDMLTSGLLLVAFGAERETMFREYEDAGQVEKFYLARVHGAPERNFTVKNRLDTADRKRTKVLDEEDEPLRWTRAEILNVDGDGTAVLGVRISKGARHQIRAHLAHAGYPIVGDPLYGADGESGRMYLHHRRIAFPGFEAECDPEW
ncbi:pseudouridine synthase [Maridesulfovibrio sp. FT414]|uniref:pseudouridine synthase n=1 Tax=Maridesulfovibrio sp. FT414 TaxID=2979469 RepID=UPI003D8085E4